MSGSGAARQPGLDKDEERKRAAKKRQEAIMQQMKAQQASFASMFGDGVDDDSDGDTAGGDGDECMSDTSGDKEEEAVSFGTCIVCQEDLNGAGGKLFGALGLIQPSRLVRRHPDGQNWHLNDVLASSFSMDRTVVNIGAGTPGNTSGMSPSTTFPPSQADLLDSKTRSPVFRRTTLFSDYTVPSAVI